MSSKSSMALAALLAAGAACSLPAAAEPERQQGMVVVRDAQTGQLRNATPAEVKALRAQQSTRGLVAPDAATITIRGNGTIQKHLGERGMVYSVARRDAYGKLGTECVTGEDAARAALERPATTTQPEHNHETR
jgi:hypothetical protein